jgi:hypothetical protein
LTFGKSLDKVEYNVTIPMLQARGFGPKWISMVKSILNTASTSILLNGVPRETIKCKKELDRGTPSPLSFLSILQIYSKLLSMMHGEEGISISQLKMTLDRNKHTI